MRAASWDIGMNSEPSTRTVANSSRSRTSRRTRGSDRVAAPDVGVQRVDGGDGLGAVHAIGILRMTGGTVARSGSASRASTAATRSATSTPQAGPTATAAARWPRAPVEVLGDAAGVVADGVDVRRRDLDQALVERTLGEVVGAHPGGLERLVGGEEVAPRVGGEPVLEGRAPSLQRERTPGLVAIALADDALARSGGGTDIVAAAVRPGRACPAGWPAAVAPRTPRPGRARRRRRTRPAASTATPGAR